MPGTYSYDPGKVTENGVDKMRLELGDTTFAPGELTAALCDEEYQSIISSTKSWKKAKIRCLEAILMKFAHQVDMSVDGLSYSFSKRIEFWKKLLDETKKTASTAVPTANPLALNGGIGGGPYFYNDLHANPRKTCPHKDPRRR